MTMTTCLSTAAPSEAEPISLYDAIGGRASLIAAVGRRINVRFQKGHEVVQPAPRPSGGTGVVADDHTHRARARSGWTDRDCAGGADRQRAKTASGGGRPAAACVPLFEALNWAHALDERVAAHCGPERKDRRIRLARSHPQRGNHGRSSLRPEQPARRLVGGGGPR